MKIAYLRPHGTWWAVVGLLPKEWQFTASGWQDAVLAVNTRAEQEGLEVQLQHHGGHTLSRPGETEPSGWREQLGLAPKHRITVRTTPSVRAWLEETYPRGRRSAAVCGMVGSAARADALRSEERTERVAVHLDAPTAGDRRFSTTRMISGTGTGNEYMPHGAARRRAARQET